MDKTLILLRRRAALLGCTLLLAACGGGGDPAPAPPPPAGSSDPSAAFVLGAAPVAGLPVAFDASGSSSPTGSALSYQWDFGDGTHGASIKLGKVFAAAGDYTVTLTVRDAAGAAAGPRVMATGIVRDLAGSALAGVTASVVGDTATATSGSDGHVTLSLASAAEILLHLSKDGYAEQFVPIGLPAGVGADAYFEARMTTRDTAQTLADAAAGGVLTGRAGVRLGLPAGALVDAHGAAVSGAVQVTLTPVDVGGAGLAAFPGRFEGLRADASRTAIVSYGTVEFRLSQGGAPLQLAPGRRATIDIPGFADARLDGTPVQAGDSVPLWALDESTGLWIQEGSGTVVATTDSPTGLALHAEVGHLSWWNWDQDLDDSYQPRPKCQDSGSGTPGSGDHFADATICNMLAQFDRGGQGVGPAQALSATTRPQAAGAVIRPGYDHSFSVPIGGGTVVALPSNQPLLLLATALNGTWVGQLAVRGAAGDSPELIVPMHALAPASGDETIILPFDQARSLATGQTVRFDFSTSGDKPVAISLQHGLGSVFTGHARLLQGSTVLAETDFGASANAAVINTAVLPSGSYVIEIANLAATGSFELQANYIHWATAAPPVGGFDQLSDTALAYDSQGHAVLMSVEQYSVAGARGFSARIVLRRLVGGAWTDAADTIELGPVTNTVPLNCIGFTLDGQDRPALIRLAPDLQTFAVTRWDGSAWQAIGPNGGALPTTDGAALANCHSHPVLAFDPSGNAVVTYEVSVTNGPQLIAQRFDGSQWSGLGPNGGAINDAVVRSLIGYSMALDPSGRPVVAWSGTGSSAVNQPAYVRRYVDTPTPGWVGVGSASGQLPLPEAGTAVYEYLYSPHVALDAAGNPVVGFAVFVNNTIASVQVSSRLTAYRFDGTQWLTGGRHSASAGSFGIAGSSLDALPMLVDATGTATLAWPEAPANAALQYFAQTWSGSAWTGLGSDTGQVDNPVTVNSTLLRLARNGAGRPAIAYLDDTNQAVGKSLNLREFVP